MPSKFWNLQDSFFAIADSRAVSEAWRQIKESVSAPWAYFLLGLAAGRLPASVLVLITSALASRQEGSLEKIDSPVHLGRDLQQAVLVRDSSLESGAGKEGNKQTSNSLPHDLDLLL